MNQSSGAGMCEEWDVSGKVTRRRTVKFTITQYVYER